METNHSVLASIHQGDWMVTLDMQDAYLHIPIHPSSKRYLRFAFQDKVYRFRALCFGLSTAPQMFTRVLAPPIPIEGQVHGGHTQASSSGPGAGPSYKSLEVPVEPFSRNPLSGDDTELYRVFWACSAQQWMSLLGTLASIEMFVSLGRLHMRVLQFYLKTN